MARAPTGWPSGPTTTTCCGRSAPCPGAVMPPSCPVPPTVERGPGPEPIDPAGRAGDVGTDRVPPDEGGAIVRKTTIRGAAVAVGLFLLAGCGSSNKDLASSRGGCPAPAPPRAG